ncbi:MAG: ArsR family transcriptional regulator [Bacillota bacterium]
MFGKRPKRRVHIISRVEEFKALADPKRIQILSLLAESRLTVKQLADRLQDLPATIHHHVKTLERSGLIQLVETREKSGILEKYYEAIADRMVADHEVGHFRDPEAIALDAAASALRKGIARLDAGRASLTHTRLEELRLSPEDAAELARRLTALLEEYSGRKQGSPWYWVSAVYPLTRE